jgi:SanA protein
MVKRMAKILLQAVLLLGCLGLLTLALPRLATSLYALPRLFSVSNVPPRRAAIVFGAGLYRNGSPTPILRDRIETAAGLYFAGKVEKLLMSGDNSYEYYNEPAAMKAYAIQLGVPEQNIVLDYAGRRTYDTCYRARSIFGLQEAILVTQTFHLHRALYTCNRLGLDSIGVSSDRPGAYSAHLRLYWNLRELPATLVALWEVNVSRPLPVLGQPEPIFPSEAQ